MPPRELLLRYLTNKQKLDKFERFMMFAGVIYPLSMTPQVLEVFRGNTEGVSAISWVISVFFSLLFITYGYIHQIRLMFMTNILWLVMQGLVVVGLLFR